MSNKQLPSLKNFVQGSLAKLGYQLQRVKPPLPFVEQIDVFSYCMTELVEHTPRKLRVLQIGANDGMRADPVFRFISEYQLDAYLLEPVPTTFELLRKNYAAFPNAKLFCVALSEATGSLEMFVPSERLLAKDPKVSGLCSANRKLLISELNGQGHTGADNEVRPIVVPTYSASDFLADQDIDQIDIIQIDTEGYDWRILSQFDLDSLGTSLVNMEFFHLTPDEQRSCLTRFGSLGFKIAHVLGDLVAYRPFASRRKI